MSNNQEFNTVTYRPAAYSDLRSQDVGRWSVLGFDEQSPYGILFTNGNDSTGFYPLIEDNSPGSAQVNKTIKKQISTLVSSGASADEAYTKIRESSGYQVFAEQEGKLEAVPALANKLKSTKPPAQDPVESFGTSAELYGIYSAEEELIELALITPTKTFLRADSSWHGLSNQDPSLDVLDDREFVQLPKEAIQKYDDNGDTLSYQEAVELRVDSL